MGELVEITVGDPSFSLPPPPVPQPLINPDFAHALSVPQPVQPRKPRRQKQPEHPQEPGLPEQKTTEEPKAKAKAKGKKDPTKDLEEQEIRRHQQLIILLSRYGGSKKFGEYLQTLGFKLGVEDLKKRTLDELENDLIRVQASINSKRTSNLAREGFFTLSQYIEAFVSASSLGQKFKVKGLTELLKKDEGVEEAIEQLEIENYENLSLSPTTRLAWALANGAMAVNAMHKMADEALARGMRFGPAPSAPSVQGDRKIPLDVSDGPKDSKIQGLSQPAAPQTALPIPPFQPGDQQDRHVPPTKVSADSLPIKTFTGLSFG